MFDLLEKVVGRGADKFAIKVHANNAAPLGDL
jgi:hypothetical protein